MRNIIEGLSKWLLSYLMVFIVLVMLPVFLITNDTSALDEMMSYLFNNS